MELSGKAAVVTGGAVRIGQAIAEGLARSGMRVCIHYGSSQHAAQEMTDRLKLEGADVVAIQADLTAPVRAARSVMAAAIEAFGQVDFLINSAAIFEPASVLETTEDVWDRHLSINLKAPFFLAKEFAARLASEQRAQILNVADWRGLRPGTGYATYTVSKSGLIALTQILAQELAPNVQVNALALGAILPPIEAPDNYRDRLAQRIPLRRTGQPSDVVEAVLFLLRSDFITGEILRITGGEEL